MKLEETYPLGSHNDVSIKTHQENNSFETDIQEDICRCDHLRKTVQATPRASTEHGNNCLACPVISMLLTLVGSAIRHKPNTSLTSAGLDEIYKNIVKTINEVYIRMSPATTYSATHSASTLLWSTSPKQFNPFLIYTWTDLKADCFLCHAANPKVVLARMTTV